MSCERAKLHWQLGIVEDAMYKELVARMELLLTKAGDDMKQKNQIEVAKDKLLQIRLEEQLVGLAKASQDARVQSQFKLEGYVHI